MQNLIAMPGGGPVTMSSREIAELCEKRHDNVMRVCRDLKAGGVTPQIEEVPFQHNGNTYSEFLLNKRDSMVLVARLSPEFTGRIVDRWLELEAGVSIPQTMPEALRLAAEEMEKRIALEHQVNENKPKVTFYDQFINADGLYTHQNAGRALGCHPNLFCAWLREAGYLFRQDGALMPYVRYRAQGLFEVKSNVCISDGKARPQSYVTPKGVEYFSSRVPDEIKVGKAA